jgi:hypothetical protein
MINLSIFIPTFNRLNCLYDLLLLIDTHHKNSSLIRNNVEVVVSSNNKNEYDKIKKFSNLSLNHFIPRVVTPYKNINGDNNIASSSSLTYGKYVWIFCDDDLCSLASIEYVLICIEKYSFSFLYLEPLILNPFKFYPNYNSQTKNINFSEEALTYLINHDKERKTLQIDNEWLANNITSLLRASSLVYSRETTHKYWTSFYYKNGNGIASFCIALDALSGGTGIRSSNPSYIYIDANKESWAKSWLYIYYFELLPVAKLFLTQNNIPFDINKFKVNRKDIYWLSISIFNNWNKFFNLFKIKQLIKYLF